MNNSPSFRASFLIIILVAGFSCQNHKAAREIESNVSSKSERPNVIVILTDDLGWSDIGCFGSEVYTPNLDKLGTQGIRFTQMYNTSKCFPSRACLLTGLYSQRTGYHADYNLPMNNAITLGEMFKIAGYTTMWSGKHHSTELPTTRGFDHYSGLFEGASNHFNPGKRREGEGQPAQKRADRPWVLDGEIIQPYTPPKDFYTTDAFTDYALNWMDNIQTSKPFFLYLSYTAPHDPLMAWPKDIEKYRGKYMDGYEAVQNRRFEKQKKLGLLSKNYPKSKPVFQNWNKLTQEQQVEEDLKMAVYSAMIDRVDQNIGRLLSKLDQMGISNNTLILFISDNGASDKVVNLKGGSGEIGSLTRWTSLGWDWANVSNVPMRYFKNYSYEGGIKTPFIAYWPKGIKNTNSISHTPLHLIDLMPTFVELTGIDYPANYRNQNIVPSDGISFLPILKGKQIKRDKPLFWQWKDGKAIREGDWKLVAHNNKWELYNLYEDPVEEKNLSKSHPEKFLELKIKYDNWIKEFE